MTVDNAGLPEGGPVDIGEAPVDTMGIVTPRRATFGAVLALLGLVVTLAVIWPSAPPPMNPVDEVLAPEPADSTRESSPGAAPLDAASGSPAVQTPPDDSPAGLLVAAAGAGDIHCVRELLAGGVAPDSESAGRFAIHGAAANGSAAALHFLVDSGAHLEALDQYGWTALTQAAFYGNAEAVVFLLSAGADPNAYAEPNNQTPLRAILSGWTMTLSRRSPLPPKDQERFAAAWALIQAGADPHFGPGDHPPPVVLAEALGGEIGRLFTEGRIDPERRPR